MDDIVVSGEALSVAGTFLGLNGESFLAHVEDKNDVFFDKPRPAQIGLGATFVPHRHAVTAGTGLANLKNRIKRKNGAQYYSDDDSRHVNMKAAKKGGKQGGVHISKPTGTGVTMEADASDSDEEEGRISMLGKRNKSDKSCVVGSGHKVGWSTRMLVSKSIPSEPGVKKKKKKKKKKNGLGGGDTPVVAIGGSGEKTVGESVASLVGKAIAANLEGLAGY